MKKQYLVVLFAILLFTECTNSREDIVASGGVSLVISEKSLTSNAQEFLVTVTSGEVWEVPSMPDWISIKSIGSYRASSVSSSKYDWDVTLSIKENTGYNRSGSMTFKSYSSSSSISFFQEGNRSSFGQENGYDWVDLGLSVKWATCNVGASLPEEYGNYYAWGETSTKSEYSFSNLKYCSTPDYSYHEQFNKYVLSGQTAYWNGSGSPDNKSRLELSDDAANKNWGGKWRTPTEAEWNELNSNCSWNWTTQDGKNGYKVTGKNGNSIFLPAAGYRGSSYSVLDVGDGYYWSSSLHPDSPADAWHLFFGSKTHSVSPFFRSCGHSIRPVTE